jgi:DnaK suppressor protein
MRRSEEMAAAGVDTERYRRDLLTKERELATRLEKSGAAAPDPGDQSVRDDGDASVQNEAKEAELRDAEADWALLNQVRDALTRIESGSYGLCLVDGAPIDTRRLDAIPWAPYCRKHQELMEQAGPPRRPTL